jgi:hypothetical protein
MYSKLVLEEAEVDLAERMQKIIEESEIRKLPAQRPR